MRQLAQLFDRLLAVRERLVDARLGLRVVSTQRLSSELQHHDGMDEALLPS